MKLPADHDTPRLPGFLREWGPYLLPAILLPGGFLIALFVWLRRQDAGRA